MTAVAPAFRRDRVVHGWIALKGISDAGDAAWMIALAWSAVNIASPTVAGLIVTAGTVPRALTLLVGGVLADRFDPRRLMIATTAVRILVLLGALAAFGSVGETLPVLFAIAIRRALRSRANSSVRTTSRLSRASGRPCLVSAECWVLPQAARSWRGADSPPPQPRTP